MVVRYARDLIQIYRQDLSLRVVDSHMPELGARLLECLATFPKEEILSPIGFRQPSTNTYDEPMFQPVFQPGSSAPGSSAGLEPGFSNLEPGASDPGGLEEPGASSSLLEAPGAQMAFCSFKIF